mmetsp:Transcript_43522/g.94558  ORF Transcript_43522/g.94558 Transcript_43522/m.94558 type:complete len:202 (-) Transcript_43522:1584-2189(-)
MAVLHCVLRGPGHKLRQRSNASSEGQVEGRDETQQEKEEGGDQLGGDQRLLPHALLGSGQFSANELHRFCALQSLCYLVSSLHRGGLRWFAFARRDRDHDLRELLRQGAAGPGFLLWAPGHPWDHVLWHPADVKPGFPHTSRFGDVLELSPVFYSATLRTPCHGCLEFLGRRTLDLGTFGIVVCICCCNDPRSDDARTALW